VVCDMSSSNRMSGIGMICRDMCDRDSSKLQLRWGTKELNSGLLFSLCLFLGDM
jgi:hypothetical protein